eukprot:scaffold7161_cov133-Cylindrotheca_fusiformis.AAC.6
MQAFLKPKKQVCFAQTVRMSTPSPLHFDEVKDLWYNRSELSAFKSQARQVVSKSRREAARAKMSDLPSLATTLDLRGLEHCTAERQLRKVLSVRCTVSAFRRGLQAEQIASIAQKCTAWNSQYAHLQGCHDYCNVYKPDMITAIPQLVNTPPAFPIAMRKRRVGEEVVGSSQRRVRRRVNPILA